MADESKSQKSLEMRVAELEDKLSKIHITEDEMKAFHKVSSLLGGGASAAPISPGANPAAGCVLDCVGGCINECQIRACVIRQCTIARFCTFPDVLPVAAASAVGDLAHWAVRPFLTCMRLLANILYLEDVSLQCG
jgi:hypothetical protein